MDNGHLSTTAFFGAFQGVVVEDRWFVHFKFSSQILILFETFDQTSELDKKVVVPLLVDDVAGTKR